MSDVDIDVLVEERAKERLKELLQEKREREERELLFRRVSELETTLQGKDLEIVELKTQLKEFADWAADLSDAVAKLEEGQLSNSARAKLIGYSAGGGISFAGLLEMLKALI